MRRSLDMNDIFIHKLSDSCDAMTDDVVHKLPRQSPNPVLWIAEYRSNVTCVAEVIWPVTFKVHSVSTKKPVANDLTHPEHLGGELVVVPRCNLLSQFLCCLLKKRKLKHFGYAVVANFSPDTSYNGKSIEQINLMKGRKHKAKEEALTVIDIMMAGGASAVFHGMSDEDVKRIMQYPFNMFASDASIRVLNAGMPHPRGYGTNARVLGKYVREEKVISLEEAIRRMTSLPAQKFQLADRGLLKEGMAADIVIFDELIVKDMATFEKPHAYSKGFHYVIVNGVMTVENEKHLGVRAGKALYHTGNQD
jgi:hypothetical protein